MTTSPIRLYRHPLSGHAHRAELMLSLLGLEADLIEVDLASGAHKAPDFLALNPLGQVPVIQDAAVTLADSNAILVYLARKYDPSGRWYPSDPEAAAAVQRWLSLAAGPLASGPAMARIITVFGVKADADKAKAIAATLLEFMNTHLTNRAFLVGEGPTIADVALFSYTAHAPEGGVSLDPYPAIQDWIARIEALPGYVAMRATPLAA
ncbi:glutathione S-transferase family protein [Pacificispira sp.]|jgi:glutathione S-transferase|uniref:glutathione S-transferase family protein n=1 Tax=Pacificispira sp. TaxID=2888761 RepID=UPI003B5274E4